MGDIPLPLLVDLYELTMANVYRRTGMADRPATFSLFVRRLPYRRGYLVAAGLEDALAWLEQLHFGPDELAVINRLGLFDDDFLAWLGELRFTGSVRAVPEGTIVFGDEPILEVDAPMAVAQLAETFLLNQVTLQTTMATTASRFRHAAAGRGVVDFAARRAHGVDAANKLVRVARIVGLQGTSNVGAADRYGLPASGTMAHSFVQAHRDELQAFREFTDAYGSRSILLVDTFDTITGVDRAVQAALELRSRGMALAGIRLDSGDLAALAREARRRLDAAGLEEVRIFASGGLDEHHVHHLVSAEAAPIDGFGVGSALGVSAEAPSLDSVYKLCVDDGRPVHKTSTGKRSWPGAKQVWRADDWSGDVLALADEPPPGEHDTPLLVEVLRDGRRTDAGARSLDDINATFEAGWSSMPPGLRHLTDPEVHPVRVSEALRQLDRRLDLEAGEEEQ